MPNWKLALIWGSFGAGAYFLLTGKRPIGAALASVGAVALASEYPDEVQALWRRAPEYLEKGNQLLAAISRISERIAERGMSGGWREVAQM
jgi:hypothetical protein